MYSSHPFFFFFFFNDTATTEIYTLSLHDALPIFGLRRLRAALFYRLRNRNNCLQTIRRDCRLQTPGCASRCDPKTSGRAKSPRRQSRSEEHTSELQSRSDLVCRLLLEKKKKK